MSLDVHAIPALLDAMALAGFTLPMASAALKAAIAQDNETHVTRETGDETHGEMVQAPRHGKPDIQAEKADIQASSSPRTSTQRVKAYRARQAAAKREGVSETPPAPVSCVSCVSSVSPLSPIGIDPKRLSVSHETPGAHPLPQGWEPSAGRRAAAVQRLGEVGTVNLVAKFCHHFHARANEVRTAAGWQGRFTNWVISEHGATAEPRLPLMRHVAASPRPADKWEAMKRRVNDYGRRESG